MKPESRLPWLRLVVLGFASGLPLLLTGPTLQAWMKTAGVDLATIGFFSLAGLPYTLKFLWSPLLDRYTLPPGRRRGWLLASQGALVGLLAAMAFSDPGRHLHLVALLAFAVTFSSSTQDIATDAWRTEILPARWQGLGSSLNILGYRLGMMAAGALALVLADRLGWRAVYLLMAALLLPGLAAAARAPEPVQTFHPGTLKEAVVEPFRHLLARPGAGLILAFVVVYMLGNSLGLALLVPFLQELGFSLTEVGLATKAVGLVTVVAGGLAGGWLMSRWPLRRSLLVFGVVQALPCVALLALALAGKQLPLMLAVVAFENLGYGLGMVAYQAFLMRLCDPGLAATQFALLSSLSALTRVVLAAPAGVLAQRFGWPGFFVLCLLLALPGLALLAVRGELLAPEG